MILKNYQVIIHNTLIMKDFEKKAKDLGIDNVAKEANEAAKHYEDKIKKADKMLNNVKAAIKR